MFYVVGSIVGIVLFRLLYSIFNMNNFGLLGIALILIACLCVGVFITTLVGLVAIPFLEIAAVLLIIQWILSKIFKGQKTE